MRCAESRFTASLKAVRRGTAGPGANHPHEPIGAQPLSMPFHPHRQHPRAHTVRKEYVHLRQPVIHRRSDVADRPAYTVHKDFERIQVARLRQVT